MSEAGISRSLKEAARAAIATDAQIAFRSEDSAVTVHGPLERNICAIVFSGAGHESARDAAASEGFADFGGIRYMIVCAASGIADGKSVLLAAAPEK